ncbi:MAG: preprotein translocase subunit YajC [Clostridia bacterium]|nr:preprotein translocase subunit YajC [Clostridia bacterium]
MNLIQFLTSEAAAATDAVSNATTTVGQSASSGFMSILMSVLPFALIILVFYFLMIRPQRKQQKEQEAMRNSIDVGDQVTTIGGIVGVVRQVKDDGDIYVIETGANNDRMTIRKWAIQSKDTISE